MAEQRIWLRHVARVQIQEQDWCVVALVPIKGSDMQALEAFKLACASVNAVVNEMFPEALAASWDAETTRIGLDEATHQKMMGYLGRNPQKPLLSWTFWYPYVPDLSLWRGTNGRQRPPF